MPAEPFGIPVIAKVENLIHRAGIVGIKDMMAGGGGNDGFQCRNHNGVIRPGIKGAMLVLQIIPLPRKCLPNGADERRFSRSRSTFDNNNARTLKSGQEVEKGMKTTTRIAAEKAARRVLLRHTPSLLFQNVLLLKCANSRGGKNRLSIVPGRRPPIPRPPERCYGANMSAL